MSINPFTRLPYSSGSTITTSGTTLDLTGNTTGVASHSDSTNATLYVLGDCALNGVCWANRLRSSLPAIITSDEHTKCNFNAIGDTNIFYPMHYIKGYTYDINTASGPISSMGFKAQDVEHVFPFLVSEVNGQKGLEYTPLIAWNWEATKRLHAQVEAHDARLNVLEEENARLRRLICTTSGQSGGSTARAPPGAAHPPARPGRHRAKPEGRDGQNQRKRYGRRPHVNIKHIRKFIRHHCP